MSPDEGLDDAARRARCQPTYAEMVEGWKQALALAEQRAQRCMDLQDQLDAMKAAQSGAPPLTPEGIDVMAEGCTGVLRDALRSSDPFRLIGAVAFELQCIAKYHQHATKAEVRVRAEFLVKLSDLLHHAKKQAMPSRAAAAPSPPEGFEDSDLDSTSVLGAMRGFLADHTRPSGSIAKDVSMHLRPSTVGCVLQIVALRTAERDAAIARAETAEKAVGTCRESFDTTRHRVLDALGLDHVKGWNHVPGAIGTIREMLAAAQSERDALARFKAYVHERLDRAGVPVDPPSEHREKGCRIGGRLDWLLSHVFAKLDSTTATPTAEGDALSLLDEAGRSLATIAMLGWLSPQGEAGVKALATRCLDASRSKRA